MAGSRLFTTDVIKMLMDSDTVDPVSDDSGDSCDPLDSEASEIDDGAGGASPGSEDTGDPTISSSDSTSDEDTSRPVTSITPTRGRARTRGASRTRGGGVRTRGGNVGARGPVKPNNGSAQKPAHGNPRQPAPGTLAGPGVHGQGQKRKRTDDTAVHVWSDIPADPPVYNFNENTGMQIQVDDITPGAYFEIFLNDDVISQMVVETNRYAAAEINSNRPLQRKSRLNEWTDTNPAEMRKFIGILLHMGPVSYPKVDTYWSCNPLYKSLFFRNVLSRNRFQLLFRFWHFADNDAADQTDRLYKIRPILDAFNDTMEMIYYPGNELAIDESMVLWRGRLVFRQYIKNKKHKYGIKLYELCESRGLVLRVQVYDGTPTADPENLGQTGAIVLKLLQGYLDKGHVVFTDNFYNSVSLTKKLATRKTYICGTLRQDRKENPTDVTNKKLKRGEHTWKRSGCVVVCKWKDKRDVLTISNMHSVEMVQVQNRHGKESIKPNLVRDYNLGMSGIDRSDQMLSYYSGLRKTIRWYKKLALHVLEIAVLNSMILYNDNNREKKTMLQMREAIVKHLIGEDTLEKLQRKAGPEEMQDAPGHGDARPLHYLEYIPPTEKKNHPTKPCRVCTANKVRKETRFYCAECIVKPALCVGKCFKDYHTIQ